MYTLTYYYTMEAVNEITQNQLIVNGLTVHGSTNLSDSLDSTNQSFIKDQMKINEMLAHKLAQNQKEIKSINDSLLSEHTTINNKIDIIDKKIIDNLTKLTKEDTLIKEKNNLFELSLMGHRSEIVNLSKKVNDYTTNLNKIKLDTNSSMENMNKNLLVSEENFQKIKEKINLVESKSSENETKLLNLSNVVQENISTWQKSKEKELEDVKSKLDNVSILFGDNYVALNTELNKFTKNICDVAVKSKENSSKIHGIEKNIEALTKQQAEHINLANDVSLKHERQLSTSLKQIEELENKLTLINTTINDLDKKNNMLTLKNNFTTEKMNTIDKRIDSQLELSKQVQTIFVNQHSTDKAFNIFKSSVSTIDKKVNELQETITIQTTQSMLNATSDLIKKIEECNINLQNEVQQKNKKIEELNKTINILTEQCGKANMTISNHETQLINVLAKISQLENKLLSQSQNIPLVAPKNSYDPSVSSISHNSTISSRSENLRKERSKTQLITLKDMKVSDDKRTIMCEIIGTTGNIYYVNSVGYPTCSCADNVLRGIRCKHIYYVLDSVLGVKNSSKEYFSFNELVKADGYKKI